MIAVLLAQQQAPTNWAPWAVVIAAVASAVLGALGGVLLKRMNRHVDDATVLRTHVEAEKMRAETDKMRVETDGQQVEIARSLLDEVRRELDRLRDQMRSDRERHSEQIIEVSAASERRYREICEQLEEVHREQGHMKQLIVEHLPWDGQAHELAIRHDPAFPPPPPLDGRAGGKGLS